MAQGIANIVAPFFGGMPATGTIARTVTNVRAGATTPVAGIVHALTLLVIVLVAAPLAVHVPLAVLAGILLFVAWNMGEWREFARLRRVQRSQYRIMLLGTFLLTVVFDLTVAMEVGLVLACVVLHLPHEHAVPASSTSRPHRSTVRVVAALRARCSSPPWPSSRNRRRAAGGHAARWCSKRTGWSRSTPRASTRCEQLHRTLARRACGCVLCALNEQPRHGAWCASGTCDAVLGAESRARTCVGARRARRRCARTAGSRRRARPDERHERIASLDAAAEPSVPRHDRARRIVARTARALSSPRRWPPARGAGAAMPFLVIAGGLSTAARSASCTSSRSQPTPARSATAPGTLRGDATGTRSCGC